MAVINGTANNDSLNGTSGVDTIFGLGGADQLFGLGHELINGIHKSSEW